MIIWDTYIWTPQGYKNYADLSVGDIIISYNNERGCTEYDSVLNIRSEYMDTGVLGIQCKSMWQAITPDHPVLVFNRNTRDVIRKPIEKAFLSTSYSYLDQILYNRWFEPYLMNKDQEGLLWSARLAASYAQVKRIQYFDEIKSFTNEITGVDARRWLDAFYHWNVMTRAYQYAKACYVKNKDIRDLIMHVGPRAGVGVLSRKITEISNRAMSISTHRDVAGKSIWYSDRMIGNFFNITTRNGNFLAARRFGTFISACDIKE